MDADFKQRYPLCGVTPSADQREDEPTRLAADARAAPACLPQAGNAPAADKLKHCHPQTSSSASVSQSAVLQLSTPVRFFMDAMRKLAKISAGVLR
jgi:hypothetical protein